MSNLKHWIWLTQRKGLAGQSAIRVLEYFGTPELVHAADEEAYRLVGGLPDAAIRSLMNKSLDLADEILGDCDRLGIRLLTLQDATYPERLKAIHQPPMVLYWKGRQFAFDEELAIAMVGTRRATPYGVQAASKLSAELTRQGALIVTGMAEGIDASAVRGALKVGGPVVSVLGGGIDRVYPWYHKDLYADVAAVGALISEYPPGTEPKGANFPIRNRIISGLSMGVIAVESGRSGGTLLTVGHALDQDREVFAVPGPIDAPESEGTNRLIQEGAAKLILGADDVLCEFSERFPSKLRPVRELSPEARAQRLEGAAIVPEYREPRGTKEKPPKEDKDDMVYLCWSDCKDKLTDDQRELLLALDGGVVQADDLVERTQIPARRVLSALTLLQIQGYVTEESGKRFRAAVKLKME
ncbi:MAG: DNA-protecting protein DprA [Clostridiales bacterium]|nr:DNA-protecting protein DprA [Clostridiales bacterium]